ncbi:UDP-N-acetylmuramate--L-alanine ligase [Lactobacillus helveticus]|uniref:UDP-N-acetylmuramate--L-alanine ligase n=3 Tax=Lactobacillus helveticus TaxID=1587 RepID=MURC_LACH4|nr:UDP-N-acetylmuramate--L-alanine ligase [Lactobacillus helveticus]A8YWG1.1 RecName: Full=UDP-N-acetylmuramate--L-alanine ligase; AltName: Full=UDP-N-acetylmuramoyl-L-alanine synthetase [Lactobacillus helveticus DPC 4571]ABX27547.1 UDP-N-acetylmuramate-alanine ligase [Lactobacillus helveticus DPC 4571]ANZ55780.1 UDP-N-acetylmuramate--L-alanine ligase [Lactobacillus helveticus]AQY53895.1 UDP-N-acetylmuramate--L-alanine ligase [Lactobacillus helveticus]AUI73923.1 UDP-N-acetylmuramate--L-alanine
MLDKNKQIWFIGIKGTGMASLALLLHDLGYNVAGSDIEKYTFTQVPLEKVGVDVKNFDPANIKSNDEQVIVKGNAFKEDNPEVKACIDKGVKWQSYPDTVEEIVQMHTSIGISGTHGKTSTTSLLSHVLGEVAPTSYLIGDGRGKGVEGSRFFVYEADEYRRHFLAYHPDYQIMTNIDFDHPDYFKDQADYTSAFQSAADQTKKALFVWGDDKRLQSLKTDIPKYTYGFKDTDDFQAVDIKKSTTGSKFHVLAHGKDLGEFEIHLFGDHSILNATAVIAVAYTEKVPMDDIREGMLTFKGAKRRFSEKDFGDIAVIDDYAHHPTEMRATIQAARQKFPDKKLVVVFQPHTFSRTKKYQKDFEEILRDVDKAYVTPIYASAREANGDISSEDLVKNIPGSEVIDLDNIADLTKNKNSVIVFMGAGDIPKYEDAFEKLL